MPAGLSLSAAGRLSGTPQIAASVGTHTVRFTVADGANTVPGQFRLVVVPAGRVDLAVTMSASPSPVTLDAPATWTLTVTNRAPQVGAQGASLEATFAGEVPFRFDAAAVGLHAGADRRPDRPHVPARSAGRRRVDDDHADGPRQLRR